jgi:hypothetical protein
LLNFFVRQQSGNIGNGPRCRPMTRSSHQGPHQGACGNPRIVVLLERKGLISCGATTSVMLPMDVCNEVCKGGHMAFAATQKFIRDHLFELLITHVEPRRPELLSALERSRRLNELASGSVGGCGHGLPISASVTGRYVSTRRFSN